MLPLMRRTETISLDTDWLWRVGLLSLADAALGLMARVHGVFARAWPIGTTALWIAVLLTTYVFFYYIA
jgi:multicomponent Na+:H+ antiporter subunit D